jgi:iron complex transport system permease protein
MIAGIALGSVRVPVGDILAVLTGGERTGARRFIIWNLRLPRVLLAALVGANLALAGSLLQSVTRNPLADPHLLGYRRWGAAGVLGLRLDPALALNNLPLLALPAARGGGAGLSAGGGRGCRRCGCCGVAVARSSRR